MLTHACHASLRTAISETPVFMRVYTARGSVNFSGTLVPLCLGDRFRAHTPASGIVFSLLSQQTDFLPD